MMHLLRRVTVAVDHTVGRNDDKGVGPAKFRLQIFKRRKSTFRILKGCLNKMDGDGMLSFPGERNKEITGLLCAICSNLLFTLHHDHQ